MSRFLSDGEAKHTADDLKEMQAWDLDRKILVTQTRIIEWYKVWHGDVYVSFSGGKDSTVLLDIARRIYPDIPAAFIETGLEYPEIKDFVKQYDNVQILHPLIWDKHAQDYVTISFRGVLERYGYPIVSKEQAAFISEYRNARSEKTKDIRWNGNKFGLGKISERHKYLVDAPFLISDRCCDIMKKNPAKVYEKQSGRKPILATMAEESQQRHSNWLMYGCNAFAANRPTSRPMSFWTEQDVLRYIKQYHLPYATVYGEILQDSTGQYYTTGCNRTGCVFCGFGVHLEKEPNRFQRLKVTHPQLWEYCMKPWNRGGAWYERSA